MQWGIFPERLLCERSNIWRVGRPHNFKGMLPVNELDLKLRICKQGMLSPIEARIGPENLLSPRSRILRLVQFFKEGTSPEKLLLERIKNMSKVREPKDLGIVPERLLFDKPIETNDCMLFQK